MKWSLVAGLSCISAVPHVYAQYQWKSLSLTGQTPIDYLFVRPHAGGTTPVTDVSSLDLRCNVKGSTSSAGATLTITGTGSLASKAKQIIWTPNTSFVTPGAWTIYLARVPFNSTASTFDGSGKVWFKIAQGTYRIPTFILDPTYVDESIPSPTYVPLDSTIPEPTLTPVGLASIKASIPLQLPTADYLVRAEFIGLSNASEKYGAKFFVSCGQISIPDGGNGVPYPLVPIPGAYSPADPGIFINLSDPILSYPFPGPPVWPPVFTTQG